MKRILSKIQVFKVRAYLIELADEIIDQLMMKVRIPGIDPEMTKKIISKCYLSLVAIVIVALNQAQYHRCFIF